MSIKDYLTSGVFTDPTADERKQKILRDAQKERRERLTENEGYAKAVIDQLLEYAVTRLHQEYGSLGSRDWPYSVDLPKIISEYIFKELDSIYGINADLETKVILSPPLFSVLKISLSVKDPAIEASVEFQVKGGLYVRIPDDLGEDKPED